MASPAKRPSARTGEASTRDPGPLSKKTAPLIPEHKKYVYRPDEMHAFIRDVTKRMLAKQVTVDAPATSFAHIKLVHTLCSAANSKVWNPECEKALVEGLPLREHHKAFLSHTMFVTMIGAVVARALEQATRGCEASLDLLADRYYVRSIACHDSSKTSIIEAAAYAGIMALDAENETPVANAKKPRGESSAANQKGGGGRGEEAEEAKAASAAAKGRSPAKPRTDPDALAVAMANLGLEHHYASNPHHPEYFRGGEMDDVHLVEAVVDGLACIFERNKAHTTVHSWLKMYNVDRFKGRNKELAQNITEALKLYVTDADYRALEAFRISVFSIFGESIPRSVIRPDEC